MAERGRPPYPDTLTPRQQEVLELIRQGLSNPQIGERLGISLDGAKFHVSEIITRLGVTSREEAAEWQRDADRASASLTIGMRLRLGRRRSLRVSTDGGRPSCWRYSKTRHQRRTYA
jgi:DNA-binding CsgD family transcriptional regulator